MKRYFYEIINYFYIIRILRRDIKLCIEHLFTRRLAKFSFNLIYKKILKNNIFLYHSQCRKVIGIHKNKC